MDAAKRYDILSYLKKLNRNLGTTMFLITHDMEAALIVDQAAILRDGKLLEFDSNSNLISSLPSGGSVVRFIIENLNEEKLTLSKIFLLPLILRLFVLEIELLRFLWIISI